MIRTLVSYVYEYEHIRGHMHNMRVIESVLALLACCFSECWVCCRYCCCCSCITWYSAQHNIVQQSALVNTWYVILGRLHLKEEQPAPNKRERLGRIISKMEGRTAAVSLITLFKSYSYRGEVQQAPSKYEVYDAATYDPAAAPASAAAPAAM